jgi:hypothetical protein
MDEEKAETLGIPSRSCINSTTIEEISFYLLYRLDMYLSNLSK